MSPELTRRGALAAGAGVPLLLASAGRTGDRVRRSRTTYGRTVRGVPLMAHRVTHTDDAHPVRARVLALGAIHGNEQAGIDVLAGLWASKVPPPLGVEYVFLFHPNADGERRDTRQNARQVDLNRNFPADWHHRGVVGDLTYSGPARLSEPESRAVTNLIDHVRPTVVLSYHQPLDYVGSIGGNQPFARVFARSVRQRYLSSSAPDGTGAVYTGTLSEWVASAHPHTLMLTTELPRRVSPALRRRHQRAITALAHTYTPLPAAAAAAAAVRSAPSIGE